MARIRGKIWILCFALSSLFTLRTEAQNVIVAVVDGARYSETFGASGTYIPHLWNDMKPLGTLYTDFRIVPPGRTETVPGHATIATGTWQQVSNDIYGVPTKPTIFEYFRREDGHPQNECYDVAGKTKLAAIAFSTYPGYGAPYGATVSAADIGDDQVYTNLVSIMDTYHPPVIIVNFSSVDRAGHTGNWTSYLAAITHADLLVYQLWQKIQTDSVYTPANTTLFVTNDHGRHDDAHGGFQNHGDLCAGCTHIMLLALGRNAIPDQAVSATRYQIDIAPTVGGLLDFNPLHAAGTGLFPIAPILLSPPDRAIDQPSTITLRWNALTGLNMYRVQVSTDSLFGTTVFDDSVVTSTSREVPSLFDATLYYWRVRASNDRWTGPYSTPWRFTTGALVTNEYVYTTGWNMVSLPLTITDRRSVAAFPTAVSSAFAYDSSQGYVARDTLDYGRGYWLKFPSGQTVSLTGTTRTLDTVRVSAGWNIIGSISEPVPVASIQQLPAGIVMSPFFRYSEGYGAADTLQPASGYWVKTSAAGRLVFGALPRANPK